MESFLTAFGLTGGTAFISYACNSFESLSLFFHMQLFCLYTFFAILLCIFFAPFLQLFAPFMQLSRAAFFHVPLFATILHNSFGKLFSDSLFSLATILQLIAFSLQLFASILKLFAPFLATLSCSFFPHAALCNYFATHL